MDKELILTNEQEAVIAHPLGVHARVLAVAGSGKTTTMVYRIKHLILDRNVSPTSIRVLMFNRLARNQFQTRMQAAGIPEGLQPRVRTFHSFAYQFIQSMKGRGLLRDTLQFWLEDKEELIRLSIHRAINQLERGGKIPPDRVDPDEARQAIDLWKGSLIPPGRAGYKGNEYIPLVYEAFEQIREEGTALTYDDFVPLTVSLLENEQSVRLEYCGTAEHVIVDEYQDVNYSQQRLIELLAGDRADLMVVGDDDQTIYEWRGARPNYIIREFRSVFDKKPHADYKLSHSFRFGPVIAQCAYNVIGFNTRRVEKPLEAFKIDQPGEIHIIESNSKQRTDANKELADQIVTLVMNKRVDPDKIIVLCRMFAQLSGIEVELLSRKVPYQVRGQRPFFERTEIRKLLHYLRLAIRLDAPISEQTKGWFLQIANTPSRMLARSDLSRALEGGKLRELSLKQVLIELADHPTSPLNSRQRDRVNELIATLETTRQRIVSEPGLTAFVLLKWLVESLDYLSHFDDYYGRGEDSYDRKLAVSNFLGYALIVGKSPADFIRHIEGLDTTRGAPENEQIVLTTVFRTKGLEYDYVLIPDCTEGFMPCLYATGNLIFDKSGIVQEPEPSEAIENERRLFYVAVTRALKAVYIGTVEGPAPGASEKTGKPLPSRFLDEIQLKPTAVVMEALQQIASGDSAGRNQLLRSVEEFGGYRRVMQILLTRYMGRISDPELAGAIADAIARSKEKPFTYRYAYRAAEIPGKLTREPKRNRHESWGNVDY